MSDPSFAQLFRRSRYCKIGPIGDDGLGNKRLEVFAVAAVGFALKYDPEFKKRFLKNFAGIEEDVEHFEPSIQSADSADLKLENKEKKILVVVEFKVWTGLKPRQDPWFGPNGQSFWRAGEGYGWQYGNMFQFSQFKRIHYTIVQQKEMAGVLREESHNEFGKAYFLRKRTWGELLKPESALERDLVDSLGELGIREFGDWRMKTMRIDPATVEDCFRGIKTIEALIWLSAKVGLPFKLWEDFEGQVLGNARYVGLSIPNYMAQLPEKRSKFIGTHKYGSGWFGYTSEDQKPFQAEVWFYCNAGMKTKLIEILKKEFDDNKFLELLEPSESEDPANCVRIQRPLHSNETDLNWFCKILGIEHL